MLALEKIIMRIGFETVSLMFIIIMLRGYHC